MKSTKLSDIFRPRQGSHKGMLDCKDWQQIWQKLSRAPAPGRAVVDARAAPRRAAPARTKLPSRMGCLWMLAAAALAAFFVPASLRGQPSNAVFVVFNTGVDKSGAPLPDGTVGDPHYFLASVPGSSSQILVRTSAGGFPIPPRLAHDDLSPWVWPKN